MRARALPVALAVALAAAGCTGSSDGPGTAQPEDAAVVGTSAPESPLTVLPDEGAAAMSVGISGALFDSAPVVVTAREDDRPGMLLAASAAVGLGVPLLVEPEDDDAAVADELDRLGAETVLAVGDAEGPTGTEVVRVPASPGAVAAVTGLSLPEADVDADAGVLGPVAALERGDPVALVGAGDEPAADDDLGELPVVESADALDGTVVLVPGSDDAVAAVATARAAGAQVVVLDGTDPRASDAARAALSDGGTESVIALGAELAAEDGLDWKLETAATGTELPGGGQTLFPGRLLVALYGHPGTGALGVMGEQPVEAAIQRARDHAASYEPVAGGRTVVPAFEIITTVASEFPGADGNYSAEADIELIRPWVEAAGEAGLYVVLDLQPGRTDFVTQAELYRPLLELPHVGLALDPEWRLGPNEVHLTQIGSVDVEEVNRVVSWLADLTRENALPQKLLVLHQFRLDMLPGRERLDTSRDELAVMVHADGQGSQGDKQATWRALHQDAPPVWWGWKNFYDEDAPMLSPDETMEQVRPAPDLVSYQ